MKKLIIAAACVALSLSMTGCACKHESTTELTCTDDKKCKECGEVLEKATGHKYDSTFTAVELNDAAIEEHAQCDVCEDFIVVDSQKVTSFVSEGKFIFDANEFMEGFEESSTRVKGYSINPKVIVDNSKSFYSDTNYLFAELEDKNNDYRSMGMLSFLIGSDNYVLYSDEYKANHFNGILFLIEDASDVSAILYATILAIDPALDYNEAADFGQGVIDNAGSSEGVTGNGINYVVLQDGGYHYLKVSVA